MFKSKKEEEIKKGETVDTSAQAAGAQENAEKNAEQGAQEGAELSESAGEQETKEQRQRSLRWRSSLQQNWQRPMTNI